MKLSAIKNAATSKLGRQILLTQKHSPKLLFVAGVAGVVGTTVLACKATLKLEDEVLDIRDENLEKANHLHETGHPGYSDKDFRQDKILIQVRATTGIVKLYAPAIGLGALSIGALCGSHIILSRRNVALTAAYATVEKAFAEYRERAVERYGPDADRELRYGFEDREIAVDTEKGTDVQVVRTADNKKVPSGYARFFDQFCSPWEPNSETNLFYLQCQQNWANDKLRARGHLFLNEVYDMIGVPHSKAGAIVGWVIGGPNSDNFVDFGIFDMGSERAREFVNGREKSILLDFNVDGVIYDLIEKKD